MANNNQNLIITMDEFCGVKHRNFKTFDNAERFIKKLAAGQYKGMDSRGRYVTVYY